MSKEHIGLAPEVAFEYGVPYQWGALHVTTQAHEAYGFVPLTADIVKGNGIETSGTSEAGLRTDIYLMAPEEFAEQADAGISGVDTPMGELGIDAVTLRHKHGNEIRLALSQGKNDFEQNLLGSISQFAEHFGADIGDIKNGDDIPIAEMIGQDSSQMLVHEFCALASGLTKESIGELLNATQNKMAVKRMRLLGASGIAGAGFMLGLSELFSGEVNLFDASLAVGLMGYYSYLSGKSMSNYLRDTDSRSRTLGMVAAGYAERVADDIHSTYCTRHFDNQAEAMFGDGSES